jgi:hypothetical protein
MKQYVSTPCRQRRGFVTGLFLTGCVVLLLPCQGVTGDRPTSRNSTTPAAYKWLAAHQSEMGLLGNQEGDDFSGVYTCAVAAMCFIHEGDIKRAERIFDVFKRRYEAEFDPGTPAGFHQFWSAATGVPHADTDRWAGDNAWLLIALNYYRQKVDRSGYDSMRAGIARWLIGLQDDDGGIRSGFNKTGPMTHKSTEANLDCYAALVDYPEARARILNWLTSKAWVPAQERFRMGSTVDESPLDATSWGIGALGRAFTNLLPYTEAHFVRTDVCDANGVNVTGFTDFLGKRRVWFEGTGQMIVAYNVAGRHDTAAKYLSEMERAMLSSEKFPGTAGLPCSSSDPSWDGATRKIFVPSQAWYLFGRWGFNPMTSDRASR